MNTNLKFRIIEKFKTQADFAEAVKSRESIVSRVVHNRTNLSDDKRLQWADALNCEPGEIFPDA